MLSADFRSSDQAPDLKVTFSSSPTPLAGLKPPVYALKPGSFIVLAALKSASGAQTYEIPSSIDLSAHRSVLIWCDQFNATMAWAPSIRTVRSALHPPGNDWGEALAPQWPSGAQPLPSAMTTSLRHGLGLMPLFLWRYAERYDLNF